MYKISVIRAEYQPEICSAYKPYATFCGVFPTGGSAPGVLGSSDWNSESNPAWYFKFSKISAISPWFQLDLTPVSPCFEPLESIWSLGYSGTMEKTTIYNWAVYSHPFYSVFQFNISLNIKSRYTSGKIFWSSSPWLMDNESPKWIVLPISVAYLRMQLTES